MTYKFSAVPSNFTWWRDVVVMRLIRSTKLLYAGQG